MIKLYNDNSKLKLKLKNWVDCGMFINITLLLIFTLNIVNIKTNKAYIAIKYIKVNLIDNLFFMVGLLNKYLIKKYSGNMHKTKMYRHINKLISIKIKTP